MTGGLPGVMIGMAIAFVDVISGGKLITQNLEKLVDKGYDALSKLGSKVLGEGKWVVDKVKIKIREQKMLNKAKMRI